MTKKQPTQSGINIIQKPMDEAFVDRRSTYVEYFEASDPTGRCGEAGEFPPSYARKRDVCLTAYIERLHGRH